MSRVGVESEVVTSASRPSARRSATGNDRPRQPGPRHTGDLADIVDLMHATGARIGEILALRWADLDLATERPTLTICGTLVFLKGQGFFRQPWPKSDADYRIIVLSPRSGRAVNVVPRAIAQAVWSLPGPRDADTGGRRQPTD